MIEFYCTVQEGCIPDSIRGSLEEAIKQCCFNALGEDQGPVDIGWSEIPEGFGFRGGRPSTTSIVRGRIPDGCDTETRTKLLMSLGDEWCRITGAGKDEVLVAARDWSYKG